MRKMPLDTVTLMHISFDCAARADFIDDCLDRLEKGTGVFARLPEVKPADVALLNQDMSPLLKYRHLGIRFADQWGSASMAERNRAQCLSAGIIVYERKRQTMEWLDCLASFEYAVVHDDLKSFPPLNVRRAVKAEMYDRTLARDHAAHVKYALLKTDQVFTQLKDCERHLRTVSI